MTDSTILLKKKKRNYKNERTDILNKIINITSSRFILSEFEKDVNKQQQISALVPEIKKYFTTGTWSAFKVNKNLEKRNLSIIKSILNDMDIEYERRICRIMVNKKPTNTTEYTIIYPQKTT